MEQKDKKGTEIGLEEWKLIGFDNIPRQTNCWDCGVFVCTYAEYLSWEAAFNFYQEHMSSFRKLIAYELDEKKLYF